MIGWEVRLPTKLFDEPRTISRVPGLDIALPNTETRHPICWESVHANSGVTRRIEGTQDRPPVLRRTPDRAVPLRQYRGRAWCGKEESAERSWLPMRSNPPPLIESVCKKAAPLADNDAMSLVSLLPTLSNVTWRADASGCLRQLGRPPLRIRSLEQPGFRHVPANAPGPEQSLTI